MKAIKYILLIFIVFTNCVKKKDYNQNSIDKIEKISFSLMYGEVENPNLLNDKIVSIVLEKDKISKTRSIYNEGHLTNETKTKLMDTPKKYLEIIDNIPSLYLENNQVFGYPNRTDEGSLGVNIELSNGEIIFWEVSHYKSELPEKIKNVYEIYEDVQKQFNINMYE
ncbi:hypothetical protein KRX57_04670 [Weeksellaceae bacterium TAE3-ERU29]|nr:hypothetical protein [Weeksellaceae bacterium TAE3-ERU29]